MSEYDLNDYTVHACVIKDSMSMTLVRGSEIAVGRGVSSQRLPHSCKQFDSIEGSARQVILKFLQATMGRKCCA